jgi:imidazolonepropionase-like amidohydrolase
MFLYARVNDGSEMAAACGCCLSVMALIQRRFDSWMAAEHAASRSSAGTGAARSLTRFVPTSVPAAPDGPIVFTNIRLFDGRSALLKDARVIVDRQKIAAVLTAGEELPAAAIVVDGGGRTLMPGLIDAHWHAIMTRPSIAVLTSAELAYLYALAIAEAEATLLRGFTTVRDMGGPTFSLKRAIDDHVTSGPRIFPSGAMISQTSGHGDFRRLSALPKMPGDPPDPSERDGVAAVADGYDQVLMRAREQLMRGATQVKYMAGGGVSSPYDPIDVTQGTVAEIRAAVEAAENWGTYVTVHAYTPRAVRIAVEAGVRCVEHGQLADDETARMLADKGIWWSLQPFGDDYDSGHFPPESPNYAKQQLVFRGTEIAYELARKHKARTAWGTDTLFSETLAAQQGARLAKMTRWYEPVDMLRMATSTNGELTALCGPRNPYPGKLGVVEAGAMADLLLVDGDPVKNIGLLAEPDKNLLLIMKDGRIHKNILTQ